MAFALIDDKFHSHPKVVDAENEAAGLWVRCLSYVQDHLLDGFISRAVVVQFCKGDEQRADDLARRLVECSKVPGGVGLWIVADGGWKMHDYHLYNPTAKQVRLVRERTREARSEAGHRSGNKRATKGHQEGNGAAANLEQKGTPRPRPRPQDPPIAPQGAAVIEGKPKNETQRALVKSHAEAACRVLEALNGGRRRAQSRSAGIGASYANLALIAERLDAGVSVEDCLRVVSVCEQEARRDPDTFKWFNTITPFRQENFAAKLARFVPPENPSEDPAEQERIYQRYLERLHEGDITKAGTA